MRGPHTEALVQRPSPFVGREAVSLTEPGGATSDLRAKGSNKPAARIECCYLTPSSMQVPPGRYSPPCAAQISLARFASPPAPAPDIVQVSCDCDHVPPCASHVFAMFRRSLPALAHPVTASARIEARTTALSNLARSIATSWLSEADCESRARRCATTHPFAGPRDGRYTQGTHSVCESGRLPA